MERRHFRNILPFTHRLLKGLTPSRNEPATPAHRPEEDSARQASKEDMDARIGKWVSSPGLQPPE
jgi:hypothetical protein